MNIRPEDIVEGNGKLTLGLIWTIILNFQVSVINQRRLQHKQQQRLSTTTTSSITTELYKNGTDTLNGNNYTVSRKVEFF